MKNKIFYRLWFRLVTFVFTTMVLSSFLVGFSAFILINFDIINVSERKSAGVIAFFVFMSVILATLLAGFIGKRFLNPIYALNKATKDITEGNFDISLQSSSRGEIGELNTNFNKMVRELQSNQMIHNDFITNVSHEFKTPLSTILGYATLLQDEELSIEEQKEYINKIIISTKRLSLLSSNILKLSKLENQEIVVNQKDFHLDEQIRNVILELESEWSKKSIILNVSLEEASFYGDANLISQIWYNILYNAIKFSNNKGTITISLENKDNSIIVIIEDNGIGMTENTQKCIFDKFYQQDSSRGLLGNGLGLAIVKRIAELSNITIEVESIENEGSKFMFFLAEKET